MSLNCTASLSALRNGKKHWKEVYEENDTDKSYDAFLSTFTTLYDKTVQLNNIIGSKTIQIDHGLQRDCKMHVKKEYSL